MAVVPIRIVGDPVLHTPTTPVRVAADGSLPAELADLIATHVRHHGRRPRGGAGGKPDRLRPSAVRLRLRRGPRRDATPPRCDHQSDPGNLRDTRDHARPGRRRRRVPCRFPASRSLPGGRRGHASPVWTPTAIRSPSRAPACSLECCNTKPGTWMDFSTSTASSAGTPERPNAPSSPTAGELPGCRGRRARSRTRSATDALVAGPRNPGDGSLPAPGRFGSAAHRCGGALAGGRAGGAGSHQDGRSGRVRARRRGRAADAGRRTGAHLGDPGTRARGRRGVAQR